MQRTHPPSPRRGGLWRWATLVAFVMSLAAAQLIGAPIAEAATVQVSPATVHPGGTVQISGDGFAPALPVRLCLDNERCSNLGTTSTLDGSFSTSGTIPADTAPGAHSISACQQVVLGWTCASGSVDVTPPPTTTSTTQPTTTTTTRPTTTTTTRPTTTTTQPRTTTTRPRTTTTQPAGTPTTAPGPTTPSGSPPPASGPADSITRPPVRSGEATTTTTEPGTDTTTTTSDAEANVAPGPMPPTDGGSGPPVQAGGSPNVAEAGATSGGGLLGLALHEWVLLIVAPALAFTVIWLVDHFGSQSRRSRHLFLESARDWRR